MVGGRKQREGTIRRAVEWLGRKQEARVKTYFDAKLK